MEVKTFEELEKIKRASMNGHVTEAESEELNKLDVDEPTDTEPVKRTKNSKKKYLVIGSLLTSLITVSYFFFNGFSETSRKNTIVAKNKDANVSMPGFSPDSASKVLINDVNSNSSLSPATNTEVNSNTNTNLPPGLQGRIQTLPPMEKNPIFGKVPNQNSSMNVPVTEQVGGNANSNTTTLPENQVRQASPATSNPNEVRGNSGINRSAVEALQLPMQSNTTEEPIKFTASQQKSYFLYTKDVSSKSIKETKPESIVQNIENKSRNEISPLVEIEKRPPFGTMLPLQTLGAIDTLGNTPLIRMVLTRTMKGEGWELERGTIFIGRATGGRGNRAFIQMIGYLDLDKNALVRIGGDLQGVDGATGLLGEKKKIGSRWLNVIREIASKAYQTANTWIGSRNGSGTNITLPNQNDMGIPVTNGNNIEYIFVRPNSFGYFLVNDLPPEIPTETSPLPKIKTDEQFDGKAEREYLTETEVINLVSQGNVDEIRKAMPRIRPEYRNSIENVLRAKKAN